MMKKNYLYTYIAASLAMLVPVPGRLAYGIILLLIFNLLMVLGTLYRFFIKNICIAEFYPVLFGVFLISATLLTKLFLEIFNPVMAMILGFAIYLPTLSSFMVGYLYNRTKGSLILDLKFNMKRSGMFSIFAFIVFIIRDFFGYGTITLPKHNGIIEIFLVKNKHFLSIGSFWASVPGALVICALLVILIAAVTKQYDLVKESVLEDLEVTDD